MEESREWSSDVLLAEEFAGFGVGKDCSYFSWGEVALANYLEQALSFRATSALVREPVVLQSNKIRPRSGERRIRKCF